MWLEPTRTAPTRTEPALIPPFAIRDTPAAIFPAASLVVAIFAVETGADLVDFADPLIRDFFVTAMVLSPRMSLKLLYALLISISRAKLCAAFSAPKMGDFHRN
jgi:hypothetical protein